MISACGVHIPLRDHISARDVGSNVNGNHPLSHRLERGRRDEADAIGLADLFNAQHTRMSRVSSCPSGEHSKAVLVRVIATSLVGRPCL